MLNKRRLLQCVAFFLLGALTLITIRFITIEKKETHYHANFAVFIDGKRFDFNNFIFYEEVQSCGGAELNNPRTRVHMHDNVNHVVHVHDTAATWGHFFTNLGMVNGDTVFKTNTDTYVETKEKPIRFILNDAEVDMTANRTIVSEDVLLVSIGTVADEMLQEQYAQISKDAGEYNYRNDPSSCSGGQPLTVGERLKQSIGVFGQ